MSRKFDDLTRFIPAITDDGFGKWIIDHEMMELRSIRCISRLLAIQNACMN